MNLFISVLFHGISYSNKSAVEKTKWTFNMSVFIAVYEEIFLPKASQRAVGAVHKVLQDKVGQYVDKDLFLPFMMWLNDPNCTNSSSEKLRKFFFQSKLMCINVS